MTTCATCTYCHNPDADGSDATPLRLQCRRYPPTVVSDRIGTATLWPSVLPEAWCGEFLEEYTAPTDKENPDA